MTAETEPKWYAELTPVERARVRVARLVNASQQLQRLGADMIWEGRQSEYYLKQGDWYMKDFHHNRYLAIQQQYQTLRRALEGRAALSERDDTTEESN